MVFNKKRIEEILEGHWVNEPSESWQVNNVVASYAQAREDYRYQRQSLFIAIDNDTWNTHIKNTDDWSDTHNTILHALPYISGIIVKTPIPQLNEDIPQFVVQDTYEALNKLAHTSYDMSDATLIATVGTNNRGIYTINALLEELLLKNKNQIVIKKKDHVSLNMLTALASASEHTEYIISNANNRALISNSQQFDKYIPDIAIISSIEETKNQTIDNNVELYTQLLENMFVDSTVILDSDSNDFEKIYSKIKRLKLNKITYGIIPNSDVFIMRNKQLGEYEQIKANVLGENSDFQTKLTGLDNLRYILSVLATLKILHIPLYRVVNYLKDFIPLKDRQQAIQYNTFSGDIYNIVDSDALPTIEGMVDSFSMLHKQRIISNGRTIAIIGGISGLTKENEESQYQVLAEEILQADIDLVIGFGEKMSYCLKHLPEIKVLGVYTSVNQLAQVTAAILKNEDNILIKGNDSSKEWSLLQDLIIKYAAQPIEFLNIKDVMPPSEGYGAATFNMKTGRKVAQYGNQYVTQNQGAGNLLIIHRVLNLLFAKKLHRSQTFTPDNEAITASRLKNAVPLEKNDEVTLEHLLSAAIISDAPNALIMLANSVLGSSENSLKMVKSMVNALGINSSIAENITGEPVEGRLQKLTLGNLFMIGNLLFTNYPAVRDILSLSSYTFKNSTYRTRSNLYDYGLITHGLFYGVNDSIGIVRSKINGEIYITVALGARSAFHRDAMIYQTLSKIMNSDIQKTKLENIRKIRKSTYRINLLGDTYFGDSYVKRTNDESLNNFLTHRTPSHSFKEIRPLLEEADFNICMLESPIFNIENTYLEQRLKDVRYSNEKNTPEILKQEDINLVSLASPHIMDSDEEGLNRTLELLEAYDIYSIGAGNKQINAEKPFVIYVNNQRYMIFNAHFYQSDNYYLFNRYAIGNESGIACLNPFIYERMSIAKREDETTKIIVIAHWGVKTQTKENDIRQRILAQRLSKAGADIIIGHGGRNMKGIEQINQTTVLYDIGVSIFNSDDDTRETIQHPYSLIPQVNVSPNHTIELKLYPIYTNNHATLWQPRFVDKREFNHCYTLLKKFGTLPNVSMQHDKQYYFSISL